jgi:RNA recognition motif-containing protein
MPSARLFVGNIPYATTEQELRDTFARAGGVTSVRIITDFDSGRSKGYAFVEMATPEDAEKAIREFNSFNLNGRTIVVNEARPRAGGAPGGGRRDRQG